MVDFSYETILVGVCFQLRFLGSWTLSVIACIMFPGTTWSPLL